MVVPEIRLHPVGAATTGDPLLASDAQPSGCDDVVSWLDETGACIEDRTPVADRDRVYPRRLIRSRYAGL